MKESYVFLSVKSAEGRHAPGNAHIAEAEYEAAKQRILHTMQEQEATSD